MLSVGKQGNVLPSGIQAPIPLNTSISERLLLILL